MPAPAIPSGAALAVATWNIHACVGADGRYRPDRVARVLDELAADVVGLQEVDSRFGRMGHDTMLDRLARATGMNQVFGPALREERGEYGNALLTRLPVRAVRHHDLAFPGREPRAALDVDLDLDLDPGGDGPVLRVLVTHLGLSARERRRQIRRLGEILDNGPMAGLTVLLADVNVHLPRSPALAPLDDRLGRAPAFRTWPAPAPLLPLDRIWVAPAAACAARAVHRGRLARLASDHLPLRAVLRPPGLAGDGAP